MRGRSGSSRRFKVALGASFWGLVNVLMFEKGDIHIAGTLGSLVLLPHAIHLPPFQGTAYSAVTVTVLAL